MILEPDQQTCWLLLVRHGATDNNQARPPRLQGRGLDDGLSEAGRQQAQRTADLARDWPLAKLYSSPLRRALETAQVIARPHGIVPETVDEITEVDVGDWEGRSWDDIEREHPEEYRAFMADAGKNPYLNGENLTQLQQRVVPVLDRMMEQNQGSLIAVAAHNVVNRVYLARQLGIDLADYRKIPQDNCGVNLLRWRRGDVKVVTINAVWHLRG